MNYRYAVIGSGMQGTAAGFDLAKFGDASEVRMLDVNIECANAAAERINRLTGTNVAKAGICDASDPSSARQVLEGMHACLSSAPYFMNERLARVAVEAGVHFNDLGGNTDVVKRELKLHDLAVAHKVSVVPDCGVAPGMANTLATYGIAQLDTAEHVHIRCGGLPQNRNLPLGYKKLFSLEGLTNEYFGEALVLKDGKVTRVKTFEGHEMIDIPGLGSLEAFVTSGGSSTCPETFEGKLKSYEYKTLRYPGHYEAMKTFRDLGFLSLDPMDVQGRALSPRTMFHAILERSLDAPNEPDLLALRVDVLGTNGGKNARFRAFILDRQDVLTGFSAMERTTAFSAAIVTAMQAKGRVERGAQPLEKSVSPTQFVQELEKRGIPMSLATEVL